MIKFQELDLNPNNFLNELNILAQSKINGGLKATNSMRLYDNGTVSAMNVVHFEAGDINKVVNQVNAPPGSFVYLPYKDNGNVLNQVNASGSDTMVILQGF
ncbi:hypothetical protein [Mastigocoleus testarum]|uniref:Uncharacterized protein n=1 Tax=Mastigocoleus testarum BC008 TaxID=371196 RepID=A0A0V7ZLH2_9CYAN|nr:hypothetical protein [Mastigocoleus testarum]KST65250.1 hypothetical protein BC008_20885 [Mastigocoleus testarum BC008]